MLVTEYKPDQWIEWTGGECPVDPMTLVQVAFRNGKTRLKVAGYFVSKKHGDHWTFSLPDNLLGWEIIAYKVLSDYAPPSE